MTKSKCVVVARGITHLATNTLPVLVIQSVFSLLPLGRYLLPLTTLNRYQLQIVVENSFLPLRQGMYLLSECIYVYWSLVTIQHYFVMIHRIRWIQRKSFRKNSNFINYIIKWDCVSTEKYRWWHWLIMVYHAIKEWTGTEKIILLQAKILVQEGRCNITVFTFEISFV